MESVSVVAETKKVKKVKKQQTESSSAQEVTLTPTETQPETQPETQQSTVNDNEFDVNTYLTDFTSLCDKLYEVSKNVKDFPMGNKENRNKLEQVIKKFMKSSSSIQSSFVDSCIKQVSIFEKNIGSKGLSEKKKITDKTKAAVHIEQPVRDFLLTFMDLPKGTLVSRSQALNSINSFVKEEKEKKNPEIFVENDKRAFKGIGKLKLLLDGISEVMKSRGITDPIPENIHYTDIMGLMSHCFYKPGEVTV
jgi:hypothetical protein